MACRVTTQWRRNYSSQPLSGTFNKTAGYTTWTETLPYKPEGRGFFSQWCHLNFLLTYPFRPRYGPGFNSANNRNEYQEYFLGGKGGGCVRLTILLPSCADCFENGWPQLPGSLRAFPGLYRDCFIPDKMQNLRLDTYIGEIGKYSGTNQKTHQRHRLQVAQIELWQTHAWGGTGQRLRRGKHARKPRGKTHCWKHEKGTQMHSQQRTQCPVWAKYLKTSILFDFFAELAEKSGGT